MPLSDIHKRKRAKNFMILAAILAWIALIWIVTMVLAGHFLGRIFPNITSYLELIVVGMILVSAIPVVITWFKNRNLLAKD